MPENNFTKQHLQVEFEAKSGKTYTEWAKEKHDIQGQLDNIKKQYHQSILLEDFEKSEALLKSVSFWAPKILAKFASGSTELDAIQYINLSKLFARIRDHLES